MGWKENFREGKELVLATCSKSGNPNANIVVSLGFADNRLLIADCQMKTTIRNLKENRKVVVVGGYCRASGTVEIFPSGRYFDICVEKSRGYKVKNAVVVSIERVFDLDKQNVVFSLG